MSYQYITDKLETWSQSYTGPKFHAVLCDPPYGLKFMGKDWDVVSAKEWGEALMPHLYPGALVLMFGGTRTWHKLATGMEEAGFEMWDTLMWLHGQGFPKGQDISKLIDKKNGHVREVIGKDRWHSSASNNRQLYGGYSAEDKRDITAPGSDASAIWTGYKTPALKPAWEPILAFRVPYTGTNADNALMYGSGTLNIDDTRIQYTGFTDPRTFVGDWSTAKTAKNVYSGGYAGERVSVSHEGRYPANLLLECICERTETVTVKQYGSTSADGPSSKTKNTWGEYKRRQSFNAYPGVAEAHTNPDCPAAQLDAQSGISVSKSGLRGAGINGDTFKAPEYESTVRGHDDSGGASRFFKQIHTNPDCPAALLDEQSGHTATHRNQKPSDCVQGGQVFSSTFQGNRGPRGFTDAGGASRFFYCAKSSTSERNAGLNSFPDKERRTLGGGLTGISGDRTGSGGSTAPLEIGISKVKNDHPCCKPLALIRYLAALLLPPAGVGQRRLLVPFAGSGSEMIGSLQAGWDEVLGIEQDTEQGYGDIAKARLAHHCGAVIDNGANSHA